jgi:hypothetical protein
MWDANNEYLKKHGFAEERRIYAHGQGYEMVERPALDLFETMEIKANMNIVVHPEALSAKGRGWVCENYIVREHGEPELLHETPQKIYSV